jgi:hypothetical protein
LRGEIAEWGEEIGCVDCSPVGMVGVEEALLEARHGWVLLELFLKPCGCCCCCCMRGRKKWGVWIDWSRVEAV